jgi:PAS domain S-box-containing protein
VAALLVPRAVCEETVAVLSSRSQPVRLDTVPFNEAIVDGLPVAASVCDRLGRVLSWNRAAAHLWGREPERGALGERYAGAYKLHGLDGADLALASGVAVNNVEAVVQRPNGSRIRCLINATPLRGEDQLVAGALVCFQPIAEPTDAVDGTLWQRRCEALLEALPVAIYTTDAAGKVAFCNEAAAALAGRRPRLGVDDWCVTWRLFTADGQPMPHSQCPMAMALLEDRPIRGIEAIAERPDGTRVDLLPFPTPLHDDAGRLIGAVNMLIDITERRRAEAELQRLSVALEEQVRARTRELADTVAELRESDRRFRLLVKSVSDYAIFMLDVDGFVANWNAGAQRIKGYTEADIVGRHFSVFYSDDDRDSGLPARALERARTTGSFEAEGWRLRQDGTRFWANVVIDPIWDDAGLLIGFAKITRDLTEKRAIEDQLRQAQKMESIGQLTGGIAHDFNNLLAIVVGNLEALKRRFEANAGGQDTQFRRLADGALRGADRAAALTRQLLAFSRQQALDPQPIEPAVLIDGVAELLRRSLGERIAVETEVPDEVWSCFADANQLESALLNLAVNARDAMPTGGRLTIGAANRRIAVPRTAGHAELQPGDYVIISVTDIGTGMSADVSAKVFEPFFTTKPLGQGSGLGLSQVYGFAKQSGGHAVVDSTLGRGTTILLYLPRFQGVPVPSALRLPDAPLPKRGGGELILLVEDDDLVRLCSAEMLQDLGYRVLAAGAAEEALQMLEDNPDIRLLFSDLGLPGALDGEALARRTRARRPEVKILLTTGYSQSGPDGRRRVAPGLEMLAKPFNFARLSEALGRLLGG